MFKKEIRTYEPQEPTLIQLFGRCVIATRRAERSSGTPEYEAAHEAALVLGRKSAFERVAGFLFGKARDADFRVDIPLPMSRMDIADYLGADDRDRLA